MYNVFVYILFVQYLVFLWVVHHLLDLNWCSGILEISLWITHFFLYFQSTRNKTQLSMIHFRFITANVDAPFMILK